MAAKKSAKNENAKSVSKTQLIKDALKKDPSGSPSAIAESLKKHGVTAQYVSTIKFNMSKKEAKPAARRKSGGKSEASFTVSELVKANKMAEELGGVEKAQELLNAISKIS